MKHLATHPHAHSSRSISGTACYGCINMCVIQRWRRIVTEEYWCDRQHRFIDPVKECEKRRDA